MIVLAQWRKIFKTATTLSFLIERTDPPLIFTYQIILRLHSSFYNMQLTFVQTSVLSIHTRSSLPFSSSSSSSSSFLFTHQPYRSSFTPASFRSSRIPIRLPSTHPSPPLQCTASSSTDFRSLDPSTPIAPILMGSSSDVSHCTKIADELRLYGFVPMLRIASAHKVPQRLLKVIAEIDALPNPKVYISVAGRSNALSGMLDGATTAPVIACPPYSDAFAGADVFSSIRMPGGVAPMLVLDPKGAALAAAKIIGQSSQKMKEAVQVSQKMQQEILYEADFNLMKDQFGQ